MGENSHIEWTDHTFNPWIGCTKVSPGCTHCYAEARDKRYAGGAHWGKGAPRQRTSAANWKLPLKWDRWAETIRGHHFDTVAKQARRPRVFCASLADWLDDEVPIEWLADLLKLIHDTPNLDWLLLTKRPENWNSRLSAWAQSRGSQWTRTESRISYWLLGEPLPNVWIGTTVEDQQRAEERIPELVKIPARVRFLSCEPLLERIDLAAACFNGADSFGTMPGIDWTIFGGESNGRVCNIEWIADGVLQCQRAGVKCFVKQIGSNAQCGNANLYDWPDSAELVGSSCIEGAAACGIRTRDRKGGDWNEWPEQLRVRQFPNPERETRNAKL